ncbi:MAG: histone deacetylase family protein [Spirochaetota bacterium]|nr:histone deacetylase family protein [Spirochaetota bacterium]
MIRIIIVRDTSSRLSKDRMRQIQDIFKYNFPHLNEYAEKIPDLISNPIQHQYCSILFVAEGALGRVDGFALVIYFSKENFCFLDFIATRSGLKGRGVGSALYESVSEYCKNLSIKGIYLEVQPDSPKLTPNPEELKLAALRIQFYEQQGVRIIENPSYSIPVGNPPTTAYLMFDGLNLTNSLSKRDVQEALKMIFETRFAKSVTLDYVNNVIESFKDDPIKFRPFLYIKSNRNAKIRQERKSSLTYTSVFSTKHEIHHIKERGYFERPVRVEVIREVINSMDGFTTVTPREHGEKWILAVHERVFVNYLRNVCSALQGRPIYPDTFPIRRPENRPKQLPVQAGYYCLDTGTPLYANAYKAARSAVNAALTGADEILAGKRLVYAVCRPPGHHAGKNFYGGFCYFNNAAIAANYLSIEGKIAILDIDFHHGNGTQDIFYTRKDVLTISIHGHPDYSYPYFSGYENEIGEGEGLNYNFNFPLPPKTEEAKYMKTLEKAINIITKFNPDIIVLSLGFDILKGDPTGTFLLGPKIFGKIASHITSIKRPLLIVQEGGYNIRGIRNGVSAFFKAIY